MRLLICTQKIDRNDPILGFFHLWVEELSKYYEKVSVICLEKGSFDLPKNVSVYSLGKESGRSRIKYLCNFYSLIFKLRNDYDTVFVHMNPEYVCLGGLVWKFFNKKISLWYTHREVDLKLRVAEKIADVIFTASKESFRLESQKLKVMGHGIDLKNFECPEYVLHNGPLKILQVGRITKIKHLESAIEMVSILKNYWNKKVILRIVGEPATQEDKKYFESLKQLIETENVSDEVEFAGSVSGQNLVNEYSNSDISLNLVPTGGIDKAVLEAMACGRIVLSSNHAFEEYFGDYSSQLLLKDFQSETIALTIKNIFEGNEVNTITQFLKRTAQEKANVSNLIRNIVKELQ